MLTLTANRASQLLALGRVTVTFKSPTGTHITVIAKCKAPNNSEKWVVGPLASAKVINFEVPNSDGWNDRIGNFSRRKGFIAAPGADPARVFCAQALLRHLQGQPLPPSLEVKVEDRCAMCGKVLTDPISIDRGIGPDCLGRATNSHHQVKSSTQWRDRKEFEKEMRADQTPAKVDKPCSQMSDLPGEIWEDIFADALGKVAV